MTRGRYIIIEGDEGSGKTTQTALVQAALQDLSLNVQTVREPGGDPFGEALRQILKHSEYHIPPIAETLTFSAGRASMLTKVVRPLLDHGTWVVSDRGYISTLVTQGIADGLDSPQFRAVVEYAIQPALPDLSIVIDISVEESELRQRGRGLPQDRFDRGPDFRAKVNQAYHDIRHPQLVHINGSGTIEQVTQRIMKTITQHFPSAHHQKNALQAAAPRVVLVHLRQF